MLLCAVVLHPSAQAQRTARAISADERTATAQEVVERIVAYRGGKARAEVHALFRADGRQVRARLVGPVGGRVHPYAGVGRRAVPPGERPYGPPLRISYLDGDPSVAMAGNDLARHSAGRGIELYLAALGGGAALIAAGAAGWAVRAVGGARARDRPRLS